MAVYEAISSRLTLRTRDATIERMESDYSSLLSGFDALTDILDDSGVIFEDYYDGSGSLADAITGSQGLAKELRDNNRRLEAENQRLGIALGNSLTGTDAIGEAGAIASDAISASLDIISKYEEGYGEDEEGSHSGSTGSIPEIPDPDRDS